MAVNLKKGQKIDLKKKGDSLDRIHVGLGWDQVEQESKGGFLGRLFSSQSSSQAEIDCDVSVLLLDSDEKLHSKEDIVYFNHLKSKCGSVVHTGDNLTGEGEGDDEVIFVTLSKVDPKYKKLVFVVNIYDCIKRNQHFGMIKNAFIRIVDKSSNTELLRYNLNEQYDNKTALIVGEIYRNKEDWKFGATGVATNDTSVKSIISNFK